MKIPRHTKNAYDPDFASFKTLVHLCARSKTLMKKLVQTNMTKIIIRNLLINQEHTKSPLDHETVQLCATHGLVQWFHGIGQRSTSNQPLLNFVTFKFSKPKQRFFYYSFSFSYQHFLKFVLLRLMVIYNTKQSYFLISVGKLSIDFKLFGNQFERQSGKKKQKIICIQH